MRQFYFTESSLQCWGSQHDPHFLQEKLKLGEVKLLYKGHTVMLICHQEPPSFLLMLPFWALKGSSVSFSLSESCSEQILPQHQLMMKAFVMEWGPKWLSGLPIPWERFGGPTAVTGAGSWIVEPLFQTLIFCQVLNSHGQGEDLPSLPL
jgi:hypothetical protein